MESQRFCDAKVGVLHPMTTDSVKGTSSTQHKVLTKHIFYHGCLDLKTEASKPFLTSDVHLGICQNREILKLQLFFGVPFQTNHEGVPKNDEPPTSKLR